MSRELIDLDVFSYLDFMMCISAVLCIAENVPQVFKKLSTAVKEIPHFSKLDSFTHSSFLLQNQTKDLIQYSLSDSPFYKCFSS